MRCRVTSSRYRVASATPVSSPRSGTLVRSLVFVILVRSRECVIRGGSRRARHRVSSGLPGILGSSPGFVILVRSLVLVNLAGSPASVNLAGSPAFGTLVRSVGCVTLGDIRLAGTPVSFRRGAPRVSSGLPGILVSSLVFGTLDPSLASVIPVGSGSFPTRMSSGLPGTPVSSAPPAMPASGRSATRRRLRRADRCSRFRRRPSLPIPAGGPGHGGPRPGRDPDLKACRGRKHGLGREARASSPPSPRRASWEHPVSAADHRSMTPYRPRP